MCPTPLLLGGVLVAGSMPIHPWQNALTQVVVLRGLQPSACVSLSGLRTMRLKGVGHPPPFSSPFSLPHLCIAPGLGVSASRSTDGANP